MNSIYVNNNYFQKGYDIDSYKNGNLNENIEDSYIEQPKNSLLDILSQIFKNKIENIKKIFQSDNKQKSEIKQNLQFISEKLEHYGFEEELYDFMEIKNIIEYLLDNINLLKKPENQNFINLLLKFEQLIEFKLKSKNNEEYSIKLEEFDDFLFNQQKIFYTEIYQRTGEYDQTIDKITNILG